MANETVCVSEGRCRGVPQGGGEGRGGRETSRNGVSRELHSLNAAVSMIFVFMRAS